MFLTLWFKWLPLLLSGVGLFLSSWIIVPAPIYLLLPLAVGAPEVSPWLLVLNAIALGLSFQVHNRRLQRFVLGASLVALILSVLPLVQLPATQERMAVAMREALGTDYLEQIPNLVQIKMRSQPFSVADAFTGIHPEQVRHTPGIQFAAPQGV
ncbi:MAG: alpha/beta hydrolase, partial [Cyanobacteriota bacterium]